MYTLLTTKLLMVINKANIKIILLMALLYYCSYYLIIIPTVFMTIKHNSTAYLGCVVDGMSIMMFHISKFGTKCNDKHMPMCFFY